MTSPFPPSGNEGYIRNRDVSDTSSLTENRSHNNYSGPFSSMLNQFSASEIVDIVKLVNYEMKLKAAVEGNSLVIQLN